MSIIMGSAVFSAGASSNLKTPRSMEGCGISQEAREGVENALKNNDYNSWKSLLETSGNSEILDVVTEDNFAKFAEAFKLKESGDIEGAKAIIKELEVDISLLPMLGEKMRVKRDGMGERNKIEEAKHEAVMEAFRSDNYEEWKLLMEERGGGKVLEIINADNFSKFAEAKILQSEDKEDEAKVILDELGFPFQERRVQKRGMGLGRLAPHAEQAISSN